MYFWSTFNTLLFFLSFMINRALSVDNVQAKFFFFIVNWFQLMFPKFTDDFAEVGEDARKQTFSHFICNKKRLNSLMFLPKTKRRNSMQGLFLAWSKRRGSVSAAGVGVV